MKALSIIQNEHRNLALTLMCFEKLLREVESAQGGSGPMLFRAIISYIDSFLNRFHHPKEDDYLFPAIFNRCPGAGELIRELQNDHSNAARYCHELGETLARHEADRVKFADFRDAAGTYIKYERLHIGKEEGVLLPLAREHLRESDWEPIGLAFSANSDPMFGDRPRQRYQQLSNLITNVCIFGDVLL